MYTSLRNVTVNTTWLHRLDHQKKKKMFQKLMDNLISTIFSCTYVHIYYISIFHICILFKNSFINISFFTIIELLKKIIHNDFSWIEYVQTKNVTWRLKAWSKVIIAHTIINGLHTVQNSAFKEFYYHWDINKKILTKNCL